MNEHAVPTCMTFFHPTLVYTYSAVPPLSSTIAITPSSARTWVKLLTTGILCIQAYTEQVYIVKHAYTMHITPCTPLTLLDNTAQALTAYPVGPVAPVTPLTPCISDETISALLQQ